MTSTIEAVLEVPPLESEELEGFSVDELEDWLELEDAEELIPLELEAEGLEEPQEVSAKEASIIFNAKLLFFI